MATTTMSRAAARGGFALWQARAPKAEVAARLGNFAGSATRRESRNWSTSTCWRPLQQQRRRLVTVFAHLQEDARKSATIHAEGRGQESYNRTTKAEANASAYPKANQRTDLGPQLSAYVQAHTREPEILRELRLETAQMPGGDMMVTSDQAQLLAMLVQLMGAKSCIEVGVFTGYSSLAVALVLPDSGRLVACERSESSLAVARKYFRRAGVSHKIDIRVGLAIDTLNELIQQGGAGSYDFAFIDADKRMYPQYYELCLQLVRPGGLVIVDNMMWHGTVADPAITDSKTEAIRNLNDFLLTDSRIDCTLVAIGDAMTLCRKL